MDIEAIGSTVYSVWGIASFFLTIVGFLSLVILAIGVFTRLGKAAWRFGLALFKKKIAIVASNDDYRDLKEDLADSGLIKEDNIIRVSDKHLTKAQDALLLIVVYEYLDKEHFRTIVSRKNARCGLIVYYPPERGRVSPEDMAILSKTAFTALCNFRGRLVNDVLLMMLSTSFKKSDLK